ncbi:hypothetical protein K438DRAFT_1987553 [Mycena galopus ATCC 62051]|nr:hypothetical protein K438DRAFT_1987553 [Mycena galopus ATCC 62051]
MCLPTPRLFLSHAAPLLLPVCVRAAAVPPHPQYQICPHPPPAPRSPHPVLVTSTGRSGAPHLSEKRSAPASCSDAATPNPHSVLGGARHRHRLYPRTTLLLERPLVRPRSSLPQLKARRSRTPRLPDKAGFGLGRVQWQLHLTSAFLFAHARPPASKMRGGRIGTTPAPAFGGSVFSFLAFLAFLVAAPSSPCPRSYNGAICAIDDTPDPQIGPRAPYRVYLAVQTRSNFSSMNAVGRLFSRSATASVGEGPGLIYIVVSFKNADGAAFRASDGKDAMPFLAQLRIKGGLTQKHRMERRRMEYVKCEQDKQHVWICAYEVSRRFYCERLLHLTLLRDGATRDRTRCECGVRHREFFDFLLVGGLSRLHATMKRILRRMGEPINRAFFAPCDETKDVYDLICAT